MPQFTYDKGKLLQVQDANLNATTYEYDKLSRVTTVHHPAGPISSYTYYGDGLLKTKTDGKGQTITYVYDKLKRLKEKQYPDGKKIVYAYSREMVGSIQDQMANETTSFAYDPSYRLSSISNPRGTMSYAFTAADQVQSYQVNSDPPVALSYYNDGSVKNITRSGESPLAYYYLLTGQKAQVLYPNNARVDYTYDDQGRLTSIINRKPDMSVLSSYTYGYDYNYSTSSYTMKGFRTSMTNQLAQMEKYYFDNLYQLTRTDYANGDVHQWSYDDIGNRTQQIVVPSGQPPVVTNYTYYQNGQSRNSQLLQSDGLSTYTWDNNGNLSAKATTQYAWDYDDRLVGISGPSTNASYVYDYQGNRIKKTVGGVDTAYLYLSEDIVKETAGGVVTNYLHGLGIDDPVIMDRAGAKSYYFSDGLGSVREMTDAVGMVQNSYTYGAWGELRAQNVTIPNSYGFTGREFAEDGLSFYRARYLDPGVGRFVSHDPIGFQGGMNIYCYVGNNPIRYSDPYGLLTWDYQIYVHYIALEEMAERFKKFAWGVARVEGSTFKCECECINGVNYPRITFLLIIDIFILNENDTFWKGSGNTFGGTNKHEFGHASRLLLNWFEKILNQLAMEEQIGYSEPECKRKCEEITNRTWRSLWWFSFWENIFDLFR